MLQTGETGLDPLPDQFPFILGDGGKDVPKETALGRCGVHVRLGDAHHIDPPTQEILNHLDQMREGPSQAVQLPDQDHLKPPPVGFFEEAIQPRALRVDPRGNTSYTPVISHLRRAANSRNSSG